MGGAGWIGVELDQVSDEALDAHIRQAWQLIVDKKRKRAAKKQTGGEVRKTLYHAC